MFTYKARLTNPVNVLLPLFITFLGVNWFTAAMLVCQEDEQLRGGVLDIVVLWTQRERVLLRGQSHFHFHSLFFKALVAPS